MMSEDTTRNPEMTEDTLADLPAISLPTTPTFSSDDETSEVEPIAPSPPVEEAPAIQNELPVTMLDLAVDDSEHPAQLDFDHVGEISDQLDEIVTQQNQPDATLDSPLILEDDLKTTDSLPDTTDGNKDYPAASEASVNPPYEHAEKLETILEFMESEKAARELAEQKQAQNTSEILKRLTLLESDHKNQVQDLEETALRERIAAIEAREKTTAETEESTTIILEQVQSIGKKLTQNLSHITTNVWAKEKLLAEQESDVKARASGLRDREADLAQKLEDINNREKALEDKIMALDERLAAVPPPTKNPNPFSTILPSSTSFLSTSPSDGPGKQRFNSNTASIYSRHAR